MPKKVDTWPTSVRGGMLVIALILAGSGFIPWAEMVCPRNSNSDLRNSHFVRIDNSPPLELQAQERESNLEPGFPQASGPMNCGTAYPHFSGVEPPQADTEDDGPPSETDQAKEIIALSGVPITTPNGGNQATTISFMSLKSKPATNQEPTQGRGTGLQPGPMTTTLEQDNQVAKL
ncbi:hypothetical protein DSO57_1027059 [Entomophthora muscae]|uniref:Uncharacterized protein n=1 Tax=Entomophthora muscae TaxID=34485 RepID=A0ACC2RGM9_9FUNG|nr:hypothetical protein DSO57_1027059 [Entomophthora muscae]